MGSYANLHLSRCSSTEDEDAYLDDTELLSKWLVPLGWLALFEPHNFHIRDLVDEDGGPYSTLQLSNDLNTALSLLKKRTTLFSEAMGDNWDRCVDSFVNHLSHTEASYVHVDFSGLIDDEATAQLLREKNIAVVEKMLPPVMTEKKTIFGKKKNILSKNWKAILDFTTDYKPNELFPCWTWFGIPPGDREDWI